MIHDEFTHLPLSKQRKWQLRRIAAGKCQLCGQPAAEDSVFCLPHLVKQRDHYNHRKTTRRNNCLSRRLQGEQTKQEVA